jgi:tripartite-type tricarboxylate transporter receptor subunit TctC
MTIERSTRRQVNRALLGGLGAAALPGTAWSQAWPAKPIRIYCGFAPGGTTDPYARMLGDHMSQKLGVPVVVENKVGAGGFISLEALKGAPPDGYTIGVTTSTSVWGSRALYRKLPFNADRDFTPISLLPVGPLLFAVPLNHPANSVREWIEIAKKRQFSMASYGQASVPHLTASDFNERYGTKIEVVHYKGEGPMWIDVVSGVVQGGVGSYVALSPHLAKGTVKVLASFGTERSPKLPQVTSMTSQGFDAELYKLNGGLAMLAPAGTPADIVKRMGDLFVEAADSPKGVALREAFAIEAKPTTTAVAQQRWRDESPIWIRLTEATGIKLD